MSEIIIKRSYNSKFFEENGRKFFRAYSGHIHYKNNNKFEEINRDLVFDDVKDGWYFDKHSYSPFIPRLSNGIAEFNDKFDGKKQTIKFQALNINQVIGEEIKNDASNPFFGDVGGIIYKDAFGENKDYLLYNLAESFMKVVSINNPNEQEKDISFSWVIEFPDKDIYRAFSKEDADNIINGEKANNNSYKLDKSGKKKLNTAKQTLVGSKNNNGKENFTYLRPYKAWDSDGNIIDIEVDIEFIEDNKAILTKTIPLLFLKNAIGKVFADTTTSYYSGSGDGYVAVGSKATWADAHDASAGTVYNYTITSSYVVANKAGAGNYQIYRTFLPIDTSAIPSGATINSASLKIYVLTKWDALSGSVACVETSQTSDTSLVNNDYPLVGTTLLSDVLDITSITSNSYATFTINSTGLALISTSGYTNIAPREKTYDIDNVDPVTTAASNGIQFYVSESSTNKSYMEITYTESTPATGFAHSQAIII